MSLLNDRGAYLTKLFEDGRIADVVPLTFGRARLVLSATADDTGYVDGW